MLSLTIFIQEELIKAQATGLLSNETVHVLCAVVVHSHCVLQRLDTRLQTEGDLGVAYCVSAKDKEITSYLSGRSSCIATDDEQNIQNGE